MRAKTKSRPRVPTLGVRTPNLDVDVVVDGVDIHIERLSPETVWMGVYSPGKPTLVVTFAAQSGVTCRFDTQVEH